MFYLDLGVEVLAYGGEYDGGEWHGPEQAEHDRDRRAWLHDHGDWLIDVFVDSDLFGPAQVVEERLYRGVAAARRRYGSRAWTGQPRAAG
jgi:hypothetical protein